MSEPAHMGPSDATFTDDDDAGDPMPAFDFAALDAAGDDDWSDDDRGPGQEDAEDEATVARGSGWTRGGRPKSPHPHRSLAALEEGEEDRDEEEEAMEEVEAATVGELEGDSAELEDDDRHPPVEIEPQSTAPTDDEELYEVQNQPADSDISGEVQEVVDLSVHDDLWAHSYSPVEPHDRTNTLHHEFYVPIPNDAQDIVDTSVPEPSRTPSSSSIELLVRPAEPLDDFDVLMDDASDQDTLTEPDLDLADDFMSHLSSQEKQGRMGVPSVVSPLPSTSTIMTETPVVEVQVEAARSPSYVSEDEDEDKDEEDRSDEAIIDRELSVLPDEDSDVDDEVEDTTTITEHASRLSTAPRPTNADASDVAEQQTQPAEADEYDHPADDDDGDESDTLDDGVIKITSDDPLAAARAAAILRLHDYDCVPRILTKKRRHSHLDAPSVIRDARRRSSLASGINKGKSSFIPNAPRRHTLGGMLGDKVFIPGSPAMTVPELLNEAERSLDLELTKQGQSMIIRRVEESRNAFVTPMKPGESSRAVDSFSWATPSFSLEDMSTPVGRPEGAWTRKDWKRLDSCLTDERLVRGEGKALADVELLDLEKVVDRFLTQLEGSSALQEPSGFNREDVLRRARALQKKQQSGRVAPPTPSSFSLLAHTQEVSSLEKECITPQGPASSTASATSSTIADGPQQPRTNSALPRPTFATRIKGLFTSYLPVASSSKTQPVKKPASAQPGLPVPPPETFAKPRAPIHTPAPKPVPKPVPPKNTVHLNNVPPPKPSRIPRGKEQPRRLVELHPLPAPPSDKPIRIDPPAKRRSSGGSVKDLIMAFEGLGEDQSSSSRPASVASVRGGSKLKERPLWRP
ncbi:hypothetical protein EVJ58_g9234 [Rhodofomes roseus]|uniref:Uncharacterized protein n=1 Tax=Rhodofomes roseus TaxID=34475 RepID=A0A4Y9XVL2_9APHY|nr:hypothetical protein EVJ58_g9234 [Rhodofomes roseus]